MRNSVKIVKITKILSILFVVCLSFSTLGIPAFSYQNTGSIILDDKADFLTDTEEETVFKAMEDLAVETGWCVAIVSSAKDLSDSRATTVAEDYFDTNFGRSSDGVLFLMDSANGNYMLHFVFAGAAEDYLYGSDATVMTNAVRPSFEDYREADSALLFLDMCENAYHNKPLTDNPDDTYYGNNESYNSYNSYNSNYHTSTDSNYFNYALVIGGIIAIVVAIAVWTRYHKHAKISASNYLNRNSINMYRRSDRFVREYTTRHVHSSSSGGGRSGGGRSSHGGGRHGGGGGGGRR